MVDHILLQYRTIQLKNQNFQVSGDSFQYKCDYGFCIPDGESHVGTLEAVVAKACSMDHPKCKAYSYSDGNRYGYLCSSVNNWGIYLDYKICVKIEPGKM